VKCLAELSGHQLVRINLSEHSDLSDLLGSNLPLTSSSDDEAHLESGSPQFSWCDGVFLKAMKNGYWVLLDELNLAPQSVLEGLNSCFDHRQRVYIPEIDQIVDRSPMFRIFCTQNPMLSGDGRKGLPQSFLSRLTSVSIKPLTDDDLFEIAKDACCDSVMACFSPQIPQIIKFVKELQLCIQEKRLYGKVGFPWEFNVRDILRLFDILRRVTTMIEKSLTFAKDLESSSLTDNILAECCNLLCKSLIRNQYFGRMLI
jgi:midasin